MRKRAIVLFLLVSMRVQAQSVIQSPECNGIIHGAVFDRSGQRAKGLKVIVWPLGVDLASLLPSNVTDEKGEYRFENVCPGRYAVVVEDEKTGYPRTSPMMSEFLYGARVRQVRVTAKHPQIELPVYLPPKPGLMQVHISNGMTKAEISKFSVKLRVPGQHRTPEAGFEFDPRFKDHQIQVPPDKNVVFHVTAEGFHEWRESAGRGKIVRVPSGTQVALEVELEPLK